MEYICQTFITWKLWLSRTKVSCLLQLINKTEGIHNSYNMSDGSFLYNNFSFWSLTLQQHMLYIPITKGAIYLVEESLWQIFSVFHRSEDVVRCGIDFICQNTDCLLNNCLVIQRFPDQKFFRGHCVIESVGNASEH